MHALSITISNNMQPLQSHQTSGAAYVVCQRGQFVGDPIRLQRGSAVQHNKRRKQARA